MEVTVVDPATTRELRRRVLRPHLAPGDPLPGDDLRDGVHIGAVDDDGTVVGTCFVFRDPCPWLPGRERAWRLRQMVTAPEHRGRGVGAAVLAGAVDHVAAQGGTLVWCHARESAAGFYARYGFERHGPVFADDEHPIPHQDMWRELSGDGASS